MNDNSNTTHGADEWTPELRRIATAHVKEFTLHGCDGELRRYRLDKFEDGAGEQIGFSFLGENLVVSYDNLVPEEAIVFADRGADTFLRLGIARVIGEDEYENQQSGI